MFPRFPAFCTDAADQYEIELWCPEELRAWRRVVEHHYSLRTMDQRLAHFPRKAVAYDALVSAWRAAVNQNECVAA